MRSDFWKAVEEDTKIVDLSYSIGLKVKQEDGTIIDVAYGGPAQKAGVPPSVKLIAVNNRQFTPTVLREAVQKTASDGKPLELLIKTGEYYETHRVDYHGGERYPHLVRDAATPGPAVADHHAEGSRSSQTFEGISFGYSEIHAKAPLIRLTLVTLAAAGRVAGLGAEPSRRTLTMEKVTDNLYVIIGDGGNVAVMPTSEGVIVVDDKFAQDAPQIMAKIKSVTDKPVRYVLNTHQHGDHTGGNEAMLAANAEIIIHKNARANMVTGKQPGTAAHHVQRRVAGVPGRQGSGRAATSAAATPTATR